MASKDKTLKIFDYFANTLGAERTLCIIAYSTVGLSIGFLIGVTKEIKTVEGDK